MVVDTSAILAILLEERHAAGVAERLAGSTSGLSMSTINFTEALTVLHGRKPAGVAALRIELLGTGIDLVPPDIEQSTIAAEARGRFPLNLGDCFAYALVRTVGGPILTLDRDFASTDVEILLPPR